MGIGELLAVLKIGDIGPTALLGLVFIAVLIGWLNPKKYLDRAWAQNEQLQTTLEKQGDSLDTLAHAVEDLKVNGATTLYALQEIQAAGRYAAEQRKATDST